ncbi:hypothetical protein EMCRGX_G023418 [Ephydatia muelleri]
MAANIPMLRQLLLLFALSKADVPDPHLPTPTLWTLGMNYSLTCVLSNLQSYAGLDVLFRLEIRGPDSTPRASQSTTSPNISCYFSPLVVSDGGNYTCNGTVFVMEDNSTHPINSAMTTITVEIPFALVPEIYPVAGLTYAGSRLLLNCTCTVVDALPNQTMVDMLWYKDSNLLLNNTYLLVGPTTPVSPTSYVKRLWFTPAMEQDSGVYLCNVTIRPMVPSMYVHSQVQSTSYRLSVTVPMVGVSLESPSHRALTMHPYNVLHLMCSATVVGVVVYPFIFSWNLVVNKSAPVAVADGINTTDSIPPVGLSSVQVTLTSPGVYVYNCSVTISEASASGSSQTTITVSGPSLPLSPTNLQALEVNTSSVLVTWTVTKVAFTPEVYSIRFWSPPSTEYTTSDKVNGTSDIGVEDMQYTILLTGLTANLHYVFQVEAKNTVGSTLSATFQQAPYGKNEEKTYSVLAVALSVPLGLFVMTGLIAGLVAMLCYRRTETCTIRKYNCPFPYEIPVTSKREPIFTEL